MQNLSNTPAETLYWVQPRWRKPIFELHLDEDLYCILRWTTYIVWDPASVFSANGQWSLIISKGLSRSTRTIYITSFDRDVAIFSFKTGSLEFINGRRFYWYSNNFWQTKWTFSSEDGENLLSFKPVNVVSLHLTIQVDLTQTVKELPEATLLAALGLYFWILENHGSAANWGPGPF